MAKVEELFGSTVTLLPPKQFLIAHESDFVPEDVGSVTSLAGKPKKEKALSFFSSSEPEFPTPNVLQDAQRSYKSTRPTGTPPPPFPPPTTKDQIFNPADYKKVDERAKNVPLAISSGPLQGLVDYLVKDTWNDIGKVRAFFVWIALQTYDKYDVDMDKTKDIAYNKLQLARVNYYDYARLFDEMCKCAGIPCEVINGCAKGFKNQDANEFGDVNHVWDAVYVDGAWRLINQAFGSGGIVGGNDEWQVVTTNLDMLKEKESTKAKEVLEMDDDYFLTDPERFIYKHFPKDPAWQLLARPVTHEEFSAMATVGQSYFKWNIRHMSEPKGLLATNTGVVELTFSPDPDRAMSFNYALFRHSKVDANTAKDDTKKKDDLHQEVRLENKGGKKIFTLSFKEIGLYKLQIYVPDTDEKSNILHCMVKYLIRCNCPYFEEVTNPKLPAGLQELGPGASWKVMGIETDVVGGVIKAKEGFASLRLMDQGKMSYLFELLSLDHPQEKDAQQHGSTLVDIQENGTNLYMKLASHGNFLLKVYTGPRNEKTLKHTANFIVESDMKCVEEAFAPKSKTGNTDSTPLLVPVTTPHSFIQVTDSTTDLMLEFDAREKAYFLLKLTFKAKDSEEESLSEFTWFETEGNRLRCFLRFPKCGTYMFGIFSKKNKDEASFTQTWKYLIQVEKPTVNCQPFPLILPGWEQSMRLLSPKSKSLKRNQEHPVEVQVDDAEKVYVEKWGENASTTLEKQPDGRTFQSTVNTLDKCDKLILYAQFPQQEGPKQLLYAEVVNDDVFTQQHSDYVKEAELAEEKQKKIEELKQRELLAAEERETQAVKKSIQDKEEFEKRKKDLYAQEAEAERVEMVQRLGTKMADMKVSGETLGQLMDKPPSPDARAVMMAVLLLLGYPEDKLKEWEDCQKIIIETGPEKILQRMTEFDVMSVTSPTLSRAKVTVQDVDRAQLREQEENPFPLFAYDWVKNVFFLHNTIADIEGTQQQQQQIIQQASTSPSPIQKVIDTLNQAGLENHHILLLLLLLILIMLYMFYNYGKECLICSLVAVIIYAVSMLQVQGSRNLALED